MNTKQRWVCGIWTAVFAWPPVAIGISDLAHGKPWWGIAGLAIVVATLVYYVPRLKRLTPSALMNEASLPLTLAYAPGVVSHWNGGLGLTNLARPAAIVFFTVLMTSFGEWADELA